MSTRHETQREIQNILNRLLDLKSHPQVWTQTDTINLWRIVHFLESRIEEDKEATVYTKAEIDLQLDNIRHELTWLRGRNDRT